MVILAFVNRKNAKASISPTSAPSSSTNPLLSKEKRTNGSNNNRFILKKGHLRNATLLFAKDEYVYIRFDGSLDLHVVCKMKVFCFLCEMYKDLREALPWAKMHACEHDLKKETTSEKIEVYVHNGELFVNVTESDSSHERSFCMRAKEFVNEYRHHKNWIDDFYIWKYGIIVKYDIYFLFHLQALEASAEAINTSNGLQYS